MGKELTIDKILNIIDRLPKGWELSINRNKLRIVLLSKICFHSDKDIRFSFKYMCYYYGIGENIIDSFDVTYDYEDCHESVYKQSKNKIKKNINRLVILKTKRQESRELYGWGKNKDIEEENRRLIKEVERLGGNI